MDPVRTVNVKVLGVLVGAAIVMVAGVFFVHGSQLRRNAGIFRNQAERAEEANRFDDAARYYHRAIKHTPQLLDSYVQLAGVYDRTDRHAEADKIMAQAVDANPNAYQAHLARARHLRQRGAEQTRELLGKEVERAYSLANDQA